MSSKGIVALLAVVVAAFGVAGGVWLGRATGDAGTATLERTRTVTHAVTTASPAAAAALPDPVEKTRAALLAAAESRDWRALGELAGDHLSYTFGDAASGPVAFWKAEEANGGRPLETLAAILRMPYTLTAGTYAWPFAYTEDPSQLTAYERRLLAPIATAKDIQGWRSFGGYLGYRAGIAPDGTWRYFVRGD